jgi:hypothetical protein
VADRLEVVAVGVADECAVVTLVVLGPQPRLVEHLRAEFDRGVAEGADRRRIRGGEGDVDLTVGPIPSKVLSQKSGLSVP